MSSHRTILSAFKLQKSLSHPYHFMRASRIGVVNRYKYVSKNDIKRSTTLDDKSLTCSDYLLENRTTLVKMSTSRER